MAGSIAFLIGILHTQAPDHWVPLSIVAWQRDWSRTRVILTTFFLHLAHVGAGLLVFLMVEPFLEMLSPDGVLAALLVMLLGAGVFRFVRFERVTAMIRTGGNGEWAIWRSFALLGPAEFLIPLLWKYRGDVNLWAPVFLAFAAGSALSGAVLVWRGSRRWLRPLELVMALRWDRRFNEAMPGVALVLLGLAFAWMK